MALNEDKINFCIRFLSQHGINPLQYETIFNKLEQLPAVEYALIRQDDSFFMQVATGLRELWPPGNKEGKWAWRESVPALVDRLKFIWRQHEVSEEYTVDDCLEAGRKYLSRFEHESTKYMQILKYFIFKQKNAGTDNKGFIRKTYESTLLNLLRDKEKEDFAQSALEGEII